MTKKIISLVMTVAAFSAAAAFAQEAPKPAAGTLMLNKKTYPLKHTIAYETKIDDEDVVAVLFSGQEVTREQLKAARAAEKEGDDPNFKRPFLRLVFKKTGEIKYWSAAAGGSMIGRRSGSATGELKQQDGRAVGKVAEAGEPGEMFSANFDLKFDVPLVKTGESLPESTAKKGGPAANVKPSVTGVFRGNGKDAKLAYVSAQWSEPFNDQPGMTLVFTEKDHSKDKKPETGALFGKYGSALIISLHDDGSIYGCQVVHSAHEKQGFSSIGSIEAPDFTYADGKVEGELTTNGEVDTFGEKWDVKLKFLAPLGEIPKEFQVAEKKEEPAAAAEDDDDAGEESAAAPAAPGPNAKELALPKDATDVEYKALVEHVLFKSKSDVKKVCAELAANLKTQGWASDGPDLINPQSSILKRKRGAATLTIFVKPEAGGSDVKILTEGLAWD